jgi:hypothetical protein
MNPSQAEKRALEQSAIELFIYLMNEHYDINYRLVQMQDKPDALLEDSKGNQMGIEITHLFYDADEARLLMGRLNHRLEGDMFLEKLIMELNKLIIRKEEKIKNYHQGYDLSLLIRNASPIYTMRDFLKARALIKKPKGLFKQVWFLSFNENNEWELYNLQSR